MQLLGNGDEVAEMAKLQEVPSAIVD